MLTHLKPAPVLLTREDWQEIAAALTRQQSNIENGNYGGVDHDSTPNGCHPDCKACANVLWLAHIEEINQKIGDDAEQAILRGVKTA